MEHKQQNQLGLTKGDQFGAVNPCSDQPINTD